MELIIFPIFFFLILAVGAIILRLACGLVGVEKPGLGRAIWIVFATFVVGFLAAIPLSMLGPLAIVGSTAVSGWLYSVMIPTDFFKGVMICLAQWVVCFVIGVGFAFLVGGGAMMTMMGSH
jgi:hypothetical protein